METYLLAHPDKYLEDKEYFPLRWLARYEEDFKIDMDKMTRPSNWKKGKKEKEKKIVVQPARNYTINYFLLSHQPNLPRVKKKKKRSGAEVWKWCADLFRKRKETKKAAELKPSR